MGKNKLIKEAKTQLYRPEGKFAIPAELIIDQDLANSIKVLKKNDFEIFRKFVIKEGYLIHGEGAHEGISYQDYALETAQHLMSEGQVVSQGSLYYIPFGKNHGWLSPIIKVSACDEGKIKALEARVGIGKK